MSRECSFWLLMGPDISFFALYVVCDYSYHPMPFIIERWNVTFRFLYKFCYWSYLSASIGGVDNDHIMGMVRGTNRLVITIVYGNALPFCYNIRLIGYAILRLLSNELSKSISISVFTNTTILLELCSVFTSLNELSICIPCSVRIGMSGSKPINNQYSPMSPCL